MESTRKPTQPNPGSGASVIPDRAVPELLAPAGDITCARAAVENGADAVYFGLGTGFNARRRATNIQIEQLNELMQFLHARGVAGYVTMNTLAFSDELATVEELARELNSAGVDAVLVQDLGVARLIRETAPELPLHASTQMSLTSAECIAVAGQLGLERVVLARELSIDEIRRIRETTDIPLEAFVHGALCVAYSGQCLTSESLGGRSANRGQCAQACRLPYELICDGEDVELGDQKYLLSPQDLAAVDLIEELHDAGICSFKIEGRLKTPEYVANITRHYRRLLDQLQQGVKPKLSPEAVRDMQMSFSRGFSPGWLEGCDHKMLVPALSSSKRGVHLGTVRRIIGRRVEIELAGPLRRGDGIVFEGNRADNAEEGGRVFEIFRKGQSLPECDNGIVELSFGNRSVRTETLRPGLGVWKTDDPVLNRQLTATFSGPPRRTVPLTFEVKAHVGQPLEIRAHTSTGLSAEYQSESELEEARRHPISLEVLQQQLGRLGKSIYHLEKVRLQSDGAPMIPLSVLGEARRTLLEQLQRVTTQQRPVTPDPVLPQLREACLPATPDSSESSPSAQITVLCRSLVQLKTALANNVRHLMADFADLREYSQAIELVRDAGASITTAVPRIHKPGEDGIFRLLEKQAPDSILVRNFAAADYFRERLPMIGDFSLNITNELTADFLLRFGFKRLTLSYDLNRDQLAELVRHIPVRHAEVVLHQHMPMFHMEHCVFCSVLSPGTNKTNCGRPCDEHVVHLRDRVGMEHRLTADIGCRNTLFNAVPQSGAELAAELLQAGVRFFRVELLSDEPEQGSRTITLYRQLLEGEVSGREVWKALNAENRIGVTRGPLEARRNPLAIL